MSPNKTHATDADVGAFLQTVTPETRAREAQDLDRLFRDVTGYGSVMWGPAIVGYGRYNYVYKSGRKGDFPATGFSPRKASFSIYIMPGYADFGPILERLGKHRMGKSCLYVNKLADIDLDVLSDLIRAGLRDLQARWPVTPT